MPVWDSSWPVSAAPPSAPANVSMLAFSVSPTSAIP